MLQLTLELPFLQWPNPSKDVFIVVKSAPLTANADADSARVATSASSTASSRGLFEGPVLMFRCVLSAAQEAGDQAGGRRSIARTDSTTRRISVELPIRP